MSKMFREDVVLEKVSGINILVALRSAWGTCPFALQISPLAAYFWNALKSGIDEEIMIQQASEERQISQEKVRRFYDHFLEASRKYHYFKQEDDET